MNHSVNKSMFNNPVNPVALNLPDYTTVITSPMDLGTVKSRCASFMYSGTTSFLTDVRLTFSNAMRYNPPAHMVHAAADSLTREFSTDYTKMVAGLRKSNSRHACRPCGGLTCRLCGLGCLKYDLPMIVCSGVCGMRIRKGAHFYVTGDGSMCWCHKCYAGLHSVLPAAVSQRRRSCEDGEGEEGEEEEDTETPVEGKVYYKRDLLKRKFDDEVAEGWVRCKGCRGMFHQVCALFNSRGVGSGRKSGPPFLCPFCVHPGVANMAGDGGAAAAAAGTVHGGPAAQHPKSPGQQPQPPASTNGQPPAITPVGASPHQQHGGHSPYSMLKKGINLLNGGSSSSSEPAAAPGASASDYASPDPGSLVLPATNTALGLRITDALLNGPAVPRGVVEGRHSAWTLISGRSTPICLPTSNHELPSSLSYGGGAEAVGDVQIDFTAAALPRTDLAAFIEAKVRDVVRSKCGDRGTPETVTVREISCIQQSTTPNDTIKNNFAGVPAKVEYLSRSIMVFQRIDNVDIAIFSMYVQEYGEDGSGPRRVYLAYLDSVEFFRPRRIRTDVYHEAVVAYFGWCKVGGFEQVHIWSCPPSRGNNFIFWAHPTSQKTPNRQRLQSWYQQLLARCVEMGICTNAHSLCDEFEDYGKLPAAEVPKCPPILAGDYWLDEASRIMKQHEKRAQSNTQSAGRKSNQIVEDKSIDLACILKTKIMNTANAQALFNVPVDPKKLGILDYFTVIKHPMDLGTVHEQLMKRRYDKLSDANRDIALVFKNAMTYNPPGHPVHVAASKLQNLYNLELSKLCEKWQSELVGGRRANADGSVVIDFSEVSLKRNVINVEAPARKKKKDGSARSNPGSRAVSPALGPGHPNDKLAAMMANQMKSREKAIERKERETADNNVRILLSAPTAQSVSQLMMGQDFTVADPAQKKGKRGLGGSKKAKREDSGGAPPMPLPIPQNLTLAAKSDKTRKSWLAVEVGKR